MAASPTSFSSTLPDTPVSLDSRRRIVLIGAKSTSGKDELAQALRRIGRQLNPRPANRSTYTQECNLTLTIRTHTYQLSFVNGHLRNSAASGIVFDAETVIGTDAFIFVYSCNSRASFIFVEEAHRRMVQQLSPTPFVLAATCSDAESSHDRMVYQSPLARVGGGGLLEAHQEPLTLRRSARSEKDIVSAQEGAARAKEWNCEFIELMSLPTSLEQVSGVLENLILFTDEIWHSDAAPSWNFLPSTKQSAQGTPDRSTGGAPEVSTVVATQNGLQDTSPAAGRGSAAKVTRGRHGICIVA